MTSRRPDNGLDGVLLIDKQQGWTSHDVVAKVRSLTGQRRTGHTGTLDPMATGLLIVCLGSATRLVEFMVGHDKRYHGAVRLGETTTTDDAEGEVLTRRSVPELTDDDLERAAAPFRGSVRQRPPAFSALKVGGKRAYQLARAGQAVEPAEREVTIHLLDVRQLSRDEVAIDVHCSAGTYVRSLARDLGETLGCGGHLSALRRETVGAFRVEQALTLDALEAVAQVGRVDEFLLPPDEAVSGLEAGVLNQEASDILCHGGWWRSDEPLLRSADPLRIYSSDGEFVGVGSAAESGEIRARKVFKR
jgi:tRNA pseudouridine55 synthase